MITGDVHFEQNVGQRAGAMYMNMTKALIFCGATFVNNTAERCGGAVMLVDSDSGLEFNGSVILRNNSADRSIGALYVEVARLVIMKIIGPCAKRTPSATIEASSRLVLAWVPCSEDLQIQTGKTSAAGYGSPSAEAYCHGRLASRGATPLFLVDPCISAIARLTLLMQISWKIKLRRVE